MLKQFEVKNIYIGKYEPNFATQGPCPDGFHVPTYPQLYSIKSIMTGLGFTNRSDYVGKLFMPLAGYRGYSSGDALGHGSKKYGKYYSCKVYSGVNVYILDLETSGGISVTTISKGNGCSIRPYKNTPVVPDSSWETIFDGSSVAAGAGIFWNESEGLISISQNGTIWITIADKNLGATTVYKNGDTMSESNCGKYYQWGNNYGFAWSGSITTSSTQVNASTYGPGNYYESSTFIIGKTDWSSVKNDNLRGGEDGNVPVS